MTRPSKMGRPVTPPASESIVARARAALGISQAAMAQKLGGVSRASVAHWEAGRYPVPGPVKLLCEQIIEETKTN